MVVLFSEDCAGPADLVASVVSSTVRSMPELAFCRVMVSGYMGSSHLAKTSAMYLYDHPRLDLLHKKTDMYILLLLLTWTFGAEQF